MNHTNLHLMIQQVITIKVYLYTVESHKYVPLFVCNQNISKVGGLYAECSAFSHNYAPLYSKVARNQPS